MRLVQKILNSEIVKLTITVGFTRHGILLHSGVTAFWTQHIVRRTPLTLNRHPGVRIVFAQGAGGAATVSTRAVPASSSEDDDFEDAGAPMMASGGGFADVKTAKRGPRVVCVYQFESELIGFRYSCTRREMEISILTPVRSPSSRVTT